MIAVLGVLLHAPFIQALIYIFFVAVGVTVVMERGRQ